MRHPLGLHVYVHRPAGATVPHMLLAEHMAIAHIFATTPIYALSPGIAADAGAMGARHAHADSDGLRCITRRASRRRSRNTRSRSRLLCGCWRWGLACGCCCMARLLEQAIHPRGFASASGRGRRQPLEQCVLLRADCGFDHLLKVVCNGMPASIRFGGGALACLLGCSVAGGGGALHYLFCPIVAEVFRRHGRWRRPGWIAGRDRRTLLYCLPTGTADTVTHAAGIALCAGRSHASPTGGE